MPPWLNATYSSGVSMRTLVVNPRAVPSSAVAVTASVPRGTMPPLTPMIVISSRPVSPSEATLSPGRNCSGSTPMSTRLLRWMRSKLSAITARTPRSLVPLAAQSRDEPEPYSLPARITSGVPSRWYCIAAS